MGKYFKNSSEIFEHVLHKFHVLSKSNHKFFFIINRVGKPGFHDPEDIKDLENEWPVHLVGNNVQSSFRRKRIRVNIPCIKIRTYVWTISILSFGKNEKSKNI